jgi:uncharacterized protein YndB with AHSA1/START domain
VLPKLTLALVLAVGAQGAVAAVADVTASGFLVKLAADIKAPPDKVYTTLVRDIGRWWNPEHTYSGDARNLSIEAKAGGCFCERLASSGGVEHLRVVFVQPGQTLRMVGALGPLQSSGLSGSLTWKLTPSGSNTKLELVYSVGGYMQGGFEKMAPAVDAMLGEQLQRLQSLIETGTPPH